MNGYGKVYKDVMRNCELTIEAKAIYAYFCSIAGADGFCFPAKRTILNDLHISQDRFYKHLKILLDAEIIERKQENGLGGYGRTIYRIRQP